jgi:hypothetical protein
MGTSKKNRGKQRKNAKQQAASSTRTDLIDINDDNVIDTCLQIAKEHIQRADDSATCGLLYPETPPPLQQAALPIVLNFLNRCEHETFAGVLASVGGDLVSPAVWIKNLVRIALVNEHCYTMQIAESIGPLVRCMCNDTERLFFRSNKHWRQGIMSFVRLISSMIGISLSNSTDKKIVNTLFQHERLLTSIVQWGHWKEHRPDIMKVLSVEDFDIITKLGRETVPVLIMDGDNFIRDEDGEITATKDGKKRLRSIGTSPIVSTDYDPTCTTSFVGGFIRLVKDKGSCHREPSSSILEHLIADADCVDKDVINEVIDLGTNHAFDFESAEFAAKLSTFIICGEVGEEIQPSDTRIAFAIRAGLVEMCLNFIRRFGHKSFYRKTDGDSLAGAIWYILLCTSDISLHQKTAKAIRSKKDEFQNQLGRLEKIATNNNTDVGMLLDMVKSILNLNGSYCCRCNKSLSKTEVKQCNGCSRMVYCSIACQKEDWLNGHNLTCCKSYTDATAGQFQGRVLPSTTLDKDEHILTYDKDGRFQGSVQPVVPIPEENERATTKLVELEKNITMIQLKLFLDNSETILSQAKVLNLPLYDCIVVFDLRRFLTRVEVKKYTDHYMPKAAKGYRKTRSKENITCIYDSYIFNGTYAAKDDEDKRQIYYVPKLSLQKMFPHEWLLNQK